MLGAMAEASRLGQPVAQVVAAEGLATRRDVLASQAQHYGAMALDRASMSPDPTLQGLIPAEFCLAHGVLPWVRLGDTLVLATARPEAFDALLPQLPPGLGPILMAVALESDIHDEISERYGAALSRAAEDWRAPEDSCRDLSLAGPRRTALAVLLGVFTITALVLAPHIFFALALALAVGSMVLTQGMKLLAIIALPRRIATDRARLPDDPPLVTVLVPLFREEDIASTLVARLSRLTYPKSLLDVILVLEAQDDTTRATLQRTPLPAWIRTVTVPPGRIQTKPRALNYALRFSRGAIVGIYDAEDAPAPDQIDQVVAHFARAAPDVGCLQGILDYYNPSANWLSRCFTVEYAGWFRVLLPGLARLGFAVPLGGTTVFFRREVLEAVQGWDAHNVTEDADLGMRLARCGWRTELIRSVTREEANNRFWPWVKQRSRWLKGYAITWWVHSRRPIRLWRDLGTKRFVGLQVLLLGTLMQFALAPVLWSFWLIFAGLPHPLDRWLDERGILVMSGLFLAVEAGSLAVGITGLARSPHRAMYHWVPTLVAYFPLGTMAIYKALWEIAARPFYWEKTQHGRSAPDRPDADLPPDTRV
ncbi:glycosyltransferase [Sagittula sp. M10.9X]|uniref:Glycosyltransferase n=2 Tax=Sagittula salina TaxID=2820268 RepID=A0A940MQ87_9RHOB|nr:glycosyltransferase [Sagittula salina]